MVHAEYMRLVRSAQLVCVRYTDAAARFPELQLMRGFDCTCHDIAAVGCSANQQRHMHAALPHKIARTSACNTTIYMSACRASTKQWFTAGKKGKVVMSSVSYDAQRSDGWYSVYAAAAVQVSVMFSYDGSNVSIAASCRSTAVQTNSSPVVRVHNVSSCTDMSVARPTACGMCIKKEYAHAFCTPLPGKCHSTRIRTSSTCAARQHAASATCAYDTY
jgi:hypothetical protein